MHAAISLALLASTAYAAVHTVDVGEQGLVFDPQTITASVGDIVIYHLYPRHDVAQGAFSSPCTPLQGGIYSGGFDKTDNGKKKFVVNVTSTDPVYVYCSVQKHCQSGMVGGINVPSSGDTIKAYSDAAKNVQQSSNSGNTSGGQLLEDEQINSITATAGGSSSTAAASPSGSGSPTPSGSAASTTAGGSSTPSGSAASTTAAGSSTSSASGSGANAGPSSTGAAVANAPTFAAAMLGVAAWFL